MNQPLLDLKARRPDLESIFPSVEAAYELLRVTFADGGKLLICGNGGSAADSDHLVGELMKAFERPRPLDAQTRQRFAQVGITSLADRLQGALPAISLASHNALMTAIGNDMAADLVFAQQVLGLGRRGDALIGISTSGNSANVLNALMVARALELRTIGLTGRTGGAMMDLCDAAICIPYERTAAIQEGHLAVYHTLSSMLEEAFFT